MFRQERIDTPLSSVGFTYFGNGLLKSSTIAGATTGFVYDARGNLSKVTDPLGAESSMDYDAAGNLTRTTDALGRETNFTHDAAGRVLSAANSLEETTTFTYDANGNRESATDARGNTTTFAYDEMDLPKAVTDALLNTTHYTYDENYNLASVKDARGNTTSYTYDAADRLKQVEDPCEQVWALDYDAAGNLTKTTHPDATSVTRTYDARNAITSLSLPTGESYEMTYTPAGRLSSVTDDEGRQSTYSYDLIGRLRKALDEHNPALASGFSVTYAHDEAGRVTGIRPSSEATRTYSYDLAGRLKTLALPTDPAGNHTSFAHNAAGERTRVSLPDGSERGYAYDGAGRLASITATTAAGVLSLDYERDANGRVVRENSDRYAYDALGRLTSWYDASEDATTMYGYDATYNLTSVAVDGSATATFTFDEANRISKFGYAYDARGNLIASPGRAYTYDGLNRLTAVIDTATDTTIATYAYDQLNRRISATEGGSTVFFHYNGASSDVIAETDESGDVLASYVYDAPGRLHSMTRGGETYYYHTNHRGDIIAMTDVAGEVVNTYAYSPYGEVLEADEDVENPYRYASYRYDETTGLYYLWNRYYDPHVFRFMTRDSYPGETGTPASFNSYVYCVDNPVMHRDPTGELTWPGEIHQAVSNHIVLQGNGGRAIQPNKFVQYEVGFGFADLYEPATGFTWEIKPDKPKYEVSGPIQLKKYTDNIPGASAGCSLGTGSFVYSSKGLLGLPMVYDVRYRSDDNGMIYYDYDTTYDSDLVGAAVGVAVLLMLAAGGFAGALGGAGATAALL